MPIYRIIEIGLYNFLNTIPYFHVMLITVRGNLRVSRRTVSMLLIALLAAETVAGSATIMGYSMVWLSSILQIVEVVLFIVIAKQNIGKSIFLLIIIANISNCISIVSKCIESHLFPEISLVPFRFTHSICIAVLEIALLIPLSIYMKRVYTPAVSGGDDSRVWHYLWIIPACFYLNWYHRVYHSDIPSGEIVRMPLNAIIMSVTTLGSILIYHLVVSMLSEHKTNLRLSKTESMLHIQQAQYTGINEKIEEAQRAQNDMRHHLAVIATMSANGQYNDLKDYIRSYSDFLPNDQITPFCENYSANALLQYAAELAKNYSVGFMVSAYLPNNLPIPDETLTVILGNLLENASDAAAAQPKGTARIKVRIETKRDYVFIRVSNNFIGEIRQNPAGQYLSSKHPGLGIGISSVVDIASQYDGFVDINHENNIFTVRVMLNFPIK